ncbi:6a9b66bd-97af-46a6-a21f-99603936441c [Thermothielavioides terrestris]|uniref:6a9b66bd-97af-46a6-a21f-99603936441c n=1 Tax=Thermothielavioides terrestris TaxID=2587410 RepID=A0A446B7X0_9PEZI|nr:6a9b66bd-97af-46a6-a21f-99603936441c [Thermothielavioides terrestris]
MAAVAPMDLIVKSNPAVIPLRCTLCPKKPGFSDLSHLLTHISSKSHLAHRFKAELRARDDHAALDEVRQYDQWCERYGINALLAERMAAKEQKKTGRRGRSSNTLNSNRDAVLSRQGSMKAEPDDYNETLSTVGYWPAVQGQFHDAVHGHSETSEYQTPNLKRSRSDPSAPSTPGNERRPKYYRSTELFDDETEANKLKGVRYPGMGLFDSADEVQKRMRNQRKADSVLKQMEEASSGIEPNEFVWAENGELQRMRDIYATPSIEGSPDRKLEDTSVPKPKRGRRSTAATAPVRASARVTKQRVSRNKRSREEGGDTTRGVSGSLESYDIFRDPPKPSAAREESPPKESSFKLRRRPALQPLNMNLPLASSGLKSAKSFSYLTPRDTETSAFASQAPVSNSHYFQHQHPMGTTSINPLCVQARGAFYNPYGFATYGNEAKPSASNFQAMSSMNLGSMSFNAFGASYTSDSVHERDDQEFDL